jgi:hypothetical protein
MAGATGAIRLTSRSSTSPSVQLATFMENAGPGSHQRLVTGAGAVHSPGAIAGLRAPAVPASRAPAALTAGAPAELDRLDPSLTRPIPRYTDPADPARPAAHPTPATTRGAR